MPHWTADGKPETHQPQHVREKKKKSHAGMILVTNAHRLELKHFSACTTGELIITSFKL